MANLGPGFDFLGCAVNGLGDIVSLAVDPMVHPGDIAIADVTGNNATKLSCDPLWNCAGISAIKVMKALGANAAAAVMAVNEIFGGRLGIDELVATGLKSEEKVSGYHAIKKRLHFNGGVKEEKRERERERERLGFNFEGSAMRERERERERVKE